MRDPTPGTREAPLTFQLPLAVEPRLSIAPHPVHANALASGGASDRRRHAPHAIAWLAM